MAKADKNKENKEKKKGSGSEASLSGQPWAMASIARYRAKGGLLGFVFGAVVAWQAHADLFVIGVWALIAGIVCRFLGWWIGITLWQSAIPAEAIARQREAHEAWQAKMEERRNQAEG